MIEHIRDVFLAPFIGWFNELFFILSDYTYIGGWWLLALGVLLASLVVGFFLPWNWARAVLGFIVWTAGVAALVATQVWNDMRKKRI